MKKAQTEKKCPDKERKQHFLSRKQEAEYGSCDPKIQESEGVDNEIVELSLVTRLVQKKSISRVFFLALFGNKRGNDQNGGKTVSDSETEYHRKDGGSMLRTNCLIKSRNGL